MALAEMYSKERCPNCVEAEALLKSMNFDVKVYKIVENVEGKVDTDNLIHILREDLLERVPTARTVPQIFINDKYIGGLSDLKIKLGNGTEF